MQVKKAIIFAAGKGTRLKLKDQHKSFVLINKTPLIEKIIKNLIIADVKEIVIIAGYRFEDFVYLSSKYDIVRVVYNKYYENNSTAVAALLITKELRGNTFVISGDMVMGRNFFLDNITAPTMSAIQGIVNKNDWVYQLDTQGNIIGYLKADTVNQLVLGEWSLLNAQWAIAIQKELQLLKTNKTIVQYQMADVLINSANKNKIKLKPYILNPEEQWDLDVPEDLARIKNLVTN